MACSYLKVRALRAEKESPAEGAAGQAQPGINSRNMSVTLNLTARLRRAIVALHWKGG